MLVSAFSKLRGLLLPHVSQLAREGAIMAPGQELIIYRTGAVNWSLLLCWIAVLLIVYFWLASCTVHNYALISPIFFRL